MGRRLQITIYLEASSVSLVPVAHIGFALVDVAIEPFGLIDLAVKEVKQLADGVEKMKKIPSTLEPSPAEDYSAIPLARHSQEA